jgi:phage recombination protein Bet
MGSQLVHQPQRPASTALGAPLEFNAEQTQMIRDMYANGATDLEFKVLMEIAKARRLNPLLKQIHFVGRFDPEKQRKVWSAQTGIDGFRAIAESTGEYDGQEEPEFIYDSQGNLTCAKVRVYRKNRKYPGVGVAFYSEYVQTKAGGQPIRMWAQMPHNQLAKCAEALAFRKVFPELGGLYTPDEMGQAENGMLEQAEVYPSGRFVEPEPGYSQNDGSHNTGTDPDPGAVDPYAAAAAQAELAFRDATDAATMAEASKLAGRLLKGAPAEIITRVKLIAAEARQRLGLAPTGTDRAPRAA